MKEESQLLPYFLYFSSAADALITPEKVAALLSFSATAFNWRAGTVPSLPLQINIDVRLEPSNFNSMLNWSVYQ